MHGIQSLTAIAHDAVNKALGSGNQLPNEEQAAAKHIGQELEGMFMSVLLKQLRQTEQGEGLFAGDKSDMLGSMFDQFLGDHIARNGGMGIAELVQQTKLIPTEFNAVDPNLGNVGREAYHNAVRTN